MPRGVYTRRATPVLTRVLKRTRYVAATGCYLYTGSLNADGYGVIGLGRRDQGTTLVHRFMYALLRHPIPADMDLDHLCRHRACCNPFHLEPVTRLVNVRRGAGHGGVLAERVLVGAL